MPLGRCSPLQGPLCDVCKRRRAVYLRTYSGEKLCAKCLERALEKAVYRSIGETRVLSPHSRILVPILLSLPSWSVALANLVSRIERRFNVKTIVALPDIISMDSTLIHADEVAIVKVRISPWPSDPIHCLRAERRWSIKAASLLDASAIILPITRTLSNLIMLYALLRGEVEGLSEASPRILDPAPQIIAGFWRAESETVAAYILTRGLHEIDPACSLSLSDAKRVFYSVAGKRPELEYGSSRSLSLLEEAARARMGRCPLCGGYTLGNGPCRYCKATRVEVTLLSSLAQSSREPLSREK